MKQIILYLVTIILFLCYLISESKRYKTEINKLNFKLETIKQNQYSDSILVYEYQSALDSFTKINPKGANQFMNLIEGENIN